MYAAQNLDKNDMGFNILGTIATVFRPSYVANMTLISAVDTGWWENSCNRSYPASAASLHSPKSVPATDAHGSEYAVVDGQ